VGLTIENLLLQIASGLNWTNPKFHNRAMSSPLFGILYPRQKRPVNCIEKSIHWLLLLLQWAMPNELGRIRLTGIETVDALVKWWPSQGSRMKNYRRHFRSVLYRKEGDNRSTTWKQERELTPTNYNEET